MTSMPPRFIPAPFPLHSSLFTLTTKHHTRYNSTFNLIRQLITKMTSVGPAGNDDRSRLRDHFTAPHTEHTKLWSQIWDKAATSSEPWLPWDRQGPNPALIDALKERQDVLGTPIEDSSVQNTVKDRGDLVGQRRKTALVPGCGKGYDVLLLASLGYDAYGLEVSEKAVEAAVVNASQTYDKYKDASAGEGKSDAGGRYTFICGDFFSDAWLVDSALNDREMKFDFIYDYTFFCALPPVLRHKWAARQSQLLSKEGRLVCLEFPLYKDPKTGGPPFGMNAETYVAHLSRPGVELKYDEAGYPEGREEEFVKARDERVALERVDRWKAVRTHKIGEGTDHVSVWKHVGGK